jgi:hypothetical protein
MYQLSDNTSEIPISISPFILITKLERYLVVLLVHFQTILSKTVSILRSEVECQFFLCPIIFSIHRPPRHLWCGNGHFCEFFYDAYTSSIADYTCIALNGRMR